MEYIVEKHIKLLNWNTRYGYMDVHANSFVFETTIRKLKRWQNIFLHYRKYIIYQIANFEVFMNVTEEMELLNGKFLLLRFIIIQIYYESIKIRNLLHK